MKSWEKGIPAAWFYVVCLICVCPDTFPVYWNLFNSQLIVDSWWWKCRAMSLADMPAVSIPMVLSCCSNVIHVIPSQRPITDFQRFFFPVFVLMIRKPSNCVLCYRPGIIRFAVHILHMIFMKAKIYDNGIVYKNKWNHAVNGWAQLLTMEMF